MKDQEILYLNLCSLKFQDSIQQKQAFPTEEFTAGTLLMNKSDVLFLKTCIFLILEYQDLKEEDKDNLLLQANRPNDKIKTTDKPKMIELIINLSKYIIKTTKQEQQFDDTFKWSFFKIGQGSHALIFLRKFSDIIIKLKLGTLGYEINHLFTGDINDLDKYYRQLLTQRSGEDDIARETYLKSFNHNQFKDVRLVDHPKYQHMDQMTGQPCEQVESQKESILKLYHGQQTVLDNMENHYFYELFRNRNLFSDLQASMIHEREEIAKNSVGLKDKLQQQPDLEILLNEPDKRDDQLSLSEYLDNECSKNLHLMTSNALMLEKFQEKLLDQVNKEVDDIQGAHVFRLAPENMGDCHNLQDLVKNANQEITKLNQVIDSLKNNSESENLFHEEIKTYSYDIIDLDFESLRLL